ncbi:hypothetical protein DAETH_11970 [Deinococcus aetherius]|uniref:AAA+ ATPase domain-containing protein n=1 Tax=Deinococcus aetherius TaxID=200252 RepID=A0ABN6RGQ6_9DEIO|nr:TniB family NTP-binding protein [Deinococcus aetherius]BDP41228.1 hypothetical protein DAETH_11970 [Deinococcus aetherius]
MSGEDFRREDGHEQKNSRHEIIRRRELLWYPEPGRQALLERLHAIATDPQRHRTRSIAIIAESNGGKSGLIQRYLTVHPPVESEEALHIPAIMVNMTQIIRVDQLSIALLECVQDIDPEAGTHAERMKRFIALAKKVKLGLIFLDEFHDCATTEGKGKGFLRCIKALIQADLCVVPVGTEALAEVLAQDPQLNTRFSFSRGRLPRLKDVNVVKSLMVKVSELEKDDISDAAVEYVLSQSRGILGHILDLVEGTLLEHGDLKLDSLRDYRKYMDVLDRVV